MSNQTENPMPDQLTNRESFPVDFTLNTDNDGAMIPALFIENDEKGDDLYLSIRNTSGSSLNLEKPSNTTPSETNYHFQLRFRPGVLSASYQKIAQVVISTNGSSPVPEWATLQGKDQNSGVDFISFLCISNQLQIAANSQYEIILKAVKADPMGGARGTNVEMRYAQLGLGDKPGSRMQHLSIVNHRGQKNIPLIASVVDLSTILNDGKTPNTLHIQIMNLSSGDMLLSDATEQPTRFSISIQAQPENEVVPSALAEKNHLVNAKVHWDIVGVIGEDAEQAERVSLSSPLNIDLPTAAVLSVSAAESGGKDSTITLSESASRGDSVLVVETKVDVRRGSSLTLIDQGEPDWSVDSPSSGESVVLWEATNSKQVILGAEGSIDFLLSNVVSGLPVGKAIININYANIPGYWDGQLPIVVHKSPLIIRNSQVGIGTSQPQGALDLKGLDGSSSLVMGLNGHGVNTLYFEKSTVLNSKTGEFLLRQGHVPDLGDQLMHYLKFDEITNGQIRNIVNAECDGTLLGDAEVTTDNVMGPSLALRGGSIKIPSFKFDFSQGFPLTISCWLYFENLPISSQVIFSSGGKNLLIMMTIDSQEVIISYYAASSAPTPFHTCASKVVLEEKKWIHLSYCCSDISHADGNDRLGMQESFFVNGKSFPVTVNYEVIGDFWGTYTQESNKIGGSIGDSNWNQVQTGQNLTAKIANLRIYQKGLDAAQIKIIKNDDFPNPQDLVQIDSLKNLNVLEGNLGIKTEDPDAELTVNGQAKILGKTSNSDPSLDVNGKVQITGGAADPSSGVAGSDGVRLIMWPGTKARTPFALGIASDTLWYGVPDVAGYGHQWFAGTKSIMQLLSSGNLNLPFGDLNVSEGHIQAKSLSVSGGFTHIGNFNTRTLPQPSKPSDGGSLAVAWNQTNGNGEVNLYNTWQTALASFQFSQLTGSNKKKDLMTLASNGNVGIGTTTPQFPLDIQTSMDKTFPFPVHVFDGKTGATGSPNNFTVPISIRTSGNIMGERFIASSDARIKGQLRTSESHADLNLLLKLNVTEYKYIDHQRNDNKTCKGLIAQEVEEVFPQAVSQHQDFIPDIYVLARNVRWDKETETLSLTLEKEHGLDEGQTVRLLGEEEHYQKEVISIIDDCTFEVGDWKAPVDQLFVYGRQVDDFRTVDYDQVAMLGVSAIQQLHKEVEELKNENQKLKTQFSNEMSALSQQVLALSEKLQKLEPSVQ